jgi:AcrR family transcriptional regulator
MQSGTEIGRRPRGRPRAFDPDTAQQQLMEAFWTDGLAGSSLDQLAAAAGVNRPSLYAAFGDKRAMYLASIARFAVLMRAGVSQALAKVTLVDALRSFYKGAIDLYLSGPSAPRGCLVVCTATVEAAHDGDVKRALHAVLGEIDAALADRIERARQAGEIVACGDPASLGRLASCVLHSIAVRARAGESRPKLIAMANDAVRLICDGPAKSVPASRAGGARRR